jgi:hypothetical protein
MQETNIQWYTFKKFKVAYLPKQAEDYIALIKCTNHNSFWASDLEQYLDVLRSRQTCGLVLFDVRNTPRDVFDADFVQLYYRYCRFWIQGLREYKESELPIRYKAMFKEAELHEEHINEETD